jgi:hypothetical protein
MQALGAIGVIALAFGLASQRVLGDWNAFNLTNVVLGAATTAAALGVGLRRWQQSRHPADSGPMLNALLMAVALSWAAVLVQGAASVAGVRFDWTFEQRYALAPATLKLLSEIEEGASQPLSLTLYYSPGDPRRRATRLLLEQMAHGRNIATDERNLDALPEEEDFYGIGSSNSVVVELGGSWELVDRTTEGSLYEALSRLARPRDRVAYAAVGAGESGLEHSNDSGFSGLRAALETEGFVVRPLRLPLLEEIPADADLLLLIAPQRQLPESALRAVRRYLDGGGGSLLAFLDPDVESSVEPLLAEFGLTSPDSLIVDPSSGPVEGDVPGLSPVAYNYSDHPITRNLDRNRMTFFRRARPFTLHKPQPEDRLRAVVHSSGDSWLHDAPLEIGRRTAPERPAGVRGNYHPIVVAGDYQRGGQNTRIAAFGDSDFASNRYLRTLYNLDLVMNAVHWATQRESEITLRPKAGRLLQFPVPIRRSVNALYGVGLLVPELIVMAGAWVWLRRRSA